MEQIIYNVAASCGAPSRGSNSQLVISASAAWSRAAYGESRSSSHAKLATTIEFRHVNGYDVYYEPTFLIVISPSWI
ncbi:unnamed protein product [Trichogramma brassicae]|uniref:Uncharacterized protein n=1 Tax=Trichogramma brassicae TaxID=86971 RepID=A0A6H5IDL3_9HYME|nr:unnamed protein product [Trichogramma brassicae]